MQEHPYNPLKREPKYARAQSAPLWELVQLARHCHPTVSMWASDLLKGELLEYPGDPLLDFGLGNFLDRISYKNPKSLEKIQKHRQRMAQFEKPINQINFSGGEKPSEVRQEEQYLYKYMNMKPPKITKTKRQPNEDDEDEEEDPSLEAFANKAIEEKMK